VLPKAASANITEHGIDIGKLKTITSSGKDGNDLKIKVGSGSYKFEYVLK